MRNAFFAVVALASAAVADATTLLSEDFSGGSIPSSWKVTSGNASVASSDQGPALRLSSACIEFPGSFTRSKDLIVEADIKIEDATFGDFNVWSFYDAVSTCSSGPDTNGYYLGIFPSGSDNPKDVLSSRRSGQTTLLDDNPARAPAQAWFHVRFRLLSSGTIDVALDGTTTLSKSNTDHTSGKLMLRSWHDVWVDNVVVSDNASAGTPPTAAFTWSPSNPTIGQSVQFTDASTGSPTSWSWSFGDGSSSTSKNPTHTFASPGSYVVSLTATNASGSNSTTHTLLVTSGGTGLACGASQTYQYIIPASANSPGANGTYFQTDASLRNLGGNSANFACFFLERDHENSGAAAWSGGIIPANETLGYINFAGIITERLNIAGAIFVCSSQPLTIMTRTYNVTSAGTLGQGIPAIALDRAVQPLQFAQATFLREDGGYRSNLGIVNLSSATNQVNAIFRDKDAATLGTKAYVLPPWGYIQVTSVLRVFSNDDLKYASVDLVSQDAPFVAYISMIDNQTGDPTYYTVDVP